MSAPAVQNGQRTGKARTGWTVERFIPLLKVCVFLACLIPLALLLWDGYQNNLGPDPIATVTHSTGFYALRFLVLSLAITPVRRLSSRLSWLIRFRRMIGLFAFFYACLHLLVYVWLFSGFSAEAMLHDIAHRPYIMAGVLAWLFMLPPALTSTRKAMRKLGGKRWQNVHQLVYFAAICGVMHYWWIVKGGVRTPVTITSILILLLAARALWPYAQARRPRSS